MENNPEKTEYQRISAKAVKLFFWQGIVAALFYMVPAIFSAFIFDFPYLFLVSGLLSIYSLIIHPRLEYNQWRYKMSSRYVDIVHGIYFTTFTHIPISRIQHLDISQGPLQKSLGLASIVIVTAGMSHKIQGVEWETAKTLLGDIRNRIYEVRL